MSEAFDHAYAEEQGLVDLYLAERLSAAERTAFEAHYFACPACLEQLEAAAELRQGMLDFAVEDSLRRHASGVLAVLALQSRQRRVALGGALLLLILAPCGWLAARNRHLERRLADVQAAVQAAPRLDARLQAVEKAAAGDRRRFAQELAAERQARTAAERDALRPLVNLPISVLAAVRGGEEPGRAPVTRIPLPPDMTPLALTMELASVDYPSYHVSLRTAAGQEIWQADGLHPDSRDALSLLLPARMLPLGVYRLSLEGVQNGGRRAAVAVYPFQVSQPAVR